MRRTTALASLVTLVALAGASTPNVDAAAEPAARVIELTDDNFDAHTADGDWLIAIGAPWCPHCRQLEPTWAALAARLAGAVHVAKVDGTKQRALVRRFHVSAYPSIYFVRDGETYEYGPSPRTEDAMADYALGGWRAGAPVNWARSPTSAWGRGVGVALRAPARARAAYDHLHGDRGWPALAVVAAFLAVPVTVGLLCIYALDVYCTRSAVAAVPRPHAE